VSEDKKDYMERKEEMAEDVEAHKLHEPEVVEEGDVEGHLLEKPDDKEVVE
jgi:hypothetical protein